MAETLTNPLHAGRAVRHKGQPDEEGRPARFDAPVDPALFDRVQAIREERRTRHPAGPAARRAYPLVRLMRCATCGSTYQGDANNGIRRVRHSRRPACATSATHRADTFESQIANLLDGLRLTDADMRQVLAVMRTTVPSPPPVPTSEEIATQRQGLQEALVARKLSLSAFSRAWRALDRPKPTTVMPPDEISIRRARKLLAGFETLWRDPAVPDRLREEALLEIFTRVEVDGSQVVAVYPKENENAWLLGYHAVRADVGLVGAKGFDPLRPTPQIVLPEIVVRALNQIA